MTNKEKYHDMLLDFALINALIAVDKNTNTLVPCSRFICSQCKLFKPGSYCEMERLKWLNEEYVETEPEIDWSNVKMDTPILVRDKEYMPWEVRYFAFYDGTKVRGWNHGRTSYTCIRGETRAWTFAKLPTPEELEKYRKKA